MTTVQFSALVRNPEINARTTYPASEIDSLAASIKAKGVIEPVVVRAVGDTAEIIDGGRRWAALKKLVDAGDIAADYAVPVYYRHQDADDFDARESSLVANIERVPLHPVDQFEEFARLSERYTPEQIASRYGVTERLVRQRVALGGLHPKIREAWRSGVLRDDAAHAFTLAADQKRQLKAFEKLAKQHNLWSHSIKAELGVNHDAAKALKIIGADAYRAAGGHFVEDLFGDDCVVSDPNLAQKLLADRLQAECDALIADGWSFAVLKESVKEPWNWPRVKPTGKAGATEEETTRLKEIEKEREGIIARGDDDDGLSDSDEQRLDALDGERDAIEEAIELRRWTAKQKKIAGCFVQILPRGINVVYGVQNPKDAKKAAKEKASKSASGDAAGDEEKPTISAALGLALSEQLTIATAKALAEDPCLALRVVVAALQRTPPTNSPLKLTANGLPALSPTRPDQELTFEAALAALVNADDAYVLERLADAVAPALDLRAYNPDHRPVGVDALLAAIDGETFLREARTAFDADAYFKAVNAALCNAALDEMGWAVTPGARPKKKAELATMCADAAREKGWLPVQMRCGEQR